MWLPLNWRASLSVFETVPQTNTPAHNCIFESAGYADGKRKRMNLREALWPLVLYDISKISSHNQQTAALPKIPAAASGLMCVLPCDLHGLHGCADILMGPLPYLYPFISHTLALHRIAAAIFVDVTNLFLDGAASAKIACQRLST